MCQPLLDDAIVALERRGDERRDAGAAGKVGVGALCQQQRDGRVALVLGGAEQRGRAGEIARIDRRALRQEQPRQPQPPGARAACASGMAPRRSRASSEAPAASSRRAAPRSPCRRRQTAPIGLYRRDVRLARS